MLNSDQRLEQFKERGYTIFENVYSPEQIEDWRTRYADMVERATMPGVEEPQYWVRNLMELEPWRMLPVVANPLILDFAERVFGPFTQLDNLTLMGFPSVSKEEAEGKVSQWHRDRWSWAPQGPQYITPWSANAITYLQDMTDDYGPLRVIEGSHRRKIPMTKEDLTKPHPEETLVRVKAGDVVFTHSAIMHSGTPNTSGNLRYFLSVYYTRSGMRTFDSHAGPAIQKIVKSAKEKNDRRIMRLFGEDDLIEARVNSGFINDDEEMWDKWISEDRAAIKV